MCVNTSHCSPLDGTTFHLCVTTVRFRVSTTAHTGVPSGTSRWLPSHYPGTAHVTLPWDLVSKAAGIGTQKKLRRRRVATTDGDVWHRAESLVDGGVNPHHGYGV